MLFRSGNAELSGCGGDMNFKSSAWRLYRICIAVCGGVVGWLYRSTSENWRPPAGIRSDTEQLSVRRGNRSATIIFTTAVRTRLAAQRWIAGTANSSVPATIWGDPVKMRVLAPPRHISGGFAKTKQLGAHVAATLAANLVDAMGNR